MRSGGGGGENFEGDRDVDFYRLPSQYQIILLMTEMVKMMRMVSLMVAMVASMGRPFAFSLANLPVFPKDEQWSTMVAPPQYVALLCLSRAGWGAAQLLVGASIVF